MKRALLLPLLGSLAVLAAPAPGRALTTVCTAAWTGASVGAGNPAGPFPLTGGASPPCPFTTVTASIPNVGDTGGNSGTINGPDAIAGSATNTFDRTSKTSIDLGVSSTSRSFSVNFKDASGNARPVDDPYLFFTYIDDKTSFTFTQNFTLEQANHASVTGPNTISGIGGNTSNDGFVVRMIGTYSTINFNYNNTSGSFQSVAFTTGIVETPGPLPLMGAGVAFGFSRRLRRRIKA